MKILGIESSGLVASVAVYENGIIQGTFTTNFKKTHSQTLLPMLDVLKDTLNLDLDTVDAIAVAAGPGSFTGLRIGSATAKGIGLAIDKPLIAVPTLEAMAYGLWGNDGLVCPMMDARRNQVFTAIYKFENGQMEVVKEQCPMDINELIEELNSLDSQVTFLGDGAVVQHDTIEEKCQVPHLFAPAHLSNQSAASLCARAAIYYEQGKTVSADDFRPDYLRLSQAERERAERLKRE